jgi:hypothetical protein
MDVRTSDQDGDAQFRHQWEQKRESIPQMNSGQAPAAVQLETS